MTALRFLFLLVTELLSVCTFSQSCKARQELTVSLLLSHCDAECSSLCGFFPNPQRWAHFLHGLISHLQRLPSGAHRRCVWVRCMEHFGACRPVGESAGQVSLVAHGWPSRWCLRCGWYDPHHSDALQEP